MTRRKAQQRSQGASRRTRSSRGTESLRCPFPRPGQHLRQAGRGERPGRDEPRPLPDGVGLAPRSLDVLASARAALPLGRAGLLDGQLRRSLDHRRRPGRSRRRWPVLSCALRHKRAGDRYADRRFGPLGSGHLPTRRRSPGLLVLLRLDASANGWSALDGFGRGFAQC